MAYTYEKTFLSSEATLTTLELLYDIETDIMLNIIGYLRRGKASATWQMEKLNDYGALNTANRRVIAKYGNTLAKYTEDEIQEAARDAIRAIEPAFDRARKAGATLLDALPPNASEPLKAILSQYQKLAVDGVNFTQQKLLEGAGRVYVDTVNKASLKIATGVISTDDAIAQTVREWSKKGIPAIVDSAGRTWSSEAYAQTVLRSSVRNVTTETQFTRCDEYGIDLIEISSHADARPGCAPYQGKVYARSGTHKRYPSFNTTSYGEPDGILGINCRHNIFPYFEGITTKTYDANPNTQRAYKQSQVQRRYERDIRASKREVAVMDKLGDKEAVERAKATLKNREDRMQSFLAESGRTRRSNRERIYEVL